MKFLIIIITVIVVYFLIKMNKQTKERTNNVDNMVMCKKCGYHVLKQKMCVTRGDIDECPNKYER